MTKKQDSFLHEAQQTGKATGKEESMNLDEAIDSVHKVINQEAVEHYKKTPEDKWEGAKMAIYCHDCRDIVPAGMATVRGKTRAVCGKCKSKKISMGREEALVSFYHISKEKS